MSTFLNLKDRPQYLEQLARWHHEQWSDLNPGETLEQRIERMKPYLNNELIPSTFIALEEELVGSAAIVANDMETQPQLTPWLASVFITPQYRRKGIGAELVSHVMLQARQSDLEFLYLFTPDREDFYRSLGWYSICKENYHGHLVTIMKMDLSNL